jgi:diguanylate cyclase (GGDEF)-like protein
MVLALLGLGAAATPHITAANGLALLAAAVDVPARLVVGWMAMDAWRRHRRTPVSALLLLVAGSVLLDLLSALIFRTAVLGSSTAALPFGDLAQLLSYVLLMLGVLMLPRTSQWRSPATTALDIAVTVGGFGLVVWFYLIRPAPQYGGYGTWLGTATELAYPLLDAALLISVLARFRGGLSRLVPEARRALVVAAVAIFVGDGFIGIAFYVARAPWMAYAASLFHGISLVALLLLAQAYRRTPGGKPFGAGDGTDSPLPPVSAAALTMALLAMGQEAVAGRTNLTLVAGAAGLGLLLVVRQLLGVRTNNRWLRERERQLDAEVRARTRELADANAQLAQLATMDALTGVANRRRFDATLAEMWSSGERAGQPLALFMLDVDAFKAFNDSYGHAAGDETLRAVAMAVRSAVKRPTDLVARYGGEEFVVLSAHTAEQGAQQIATTICEGVLAAALPHRASPVASYVTVSIGVAVCVPSRASTPAALCAAADAALYEAKRQGRNRVVVAAAVPNALPANVPA